MIVYILAVAVLNIAVGFTLAMHLGQRYRALWRPAVLRRPRSFATRPRPQSRQVPP